jgi:hypothetical protein
MRKWCRNSGIKCYACTARACALSAKIVSTIVNQWCHGGMVAILKSCDWLTAISASSAHLHRVACDASDSCQPITWHSRCHQLIVDWLTWILAPFVHYRSTSTWRLLSPNWQICAHIKEKNVHAQKYFCAHNTISAFWIWLIDQSGLLWTQCKICMHRKYFLPCTLSNATHPVPDPHLFFKRRLLTPS